MNTCKVSPHLFVRSCNKIFCIQTISHLCDVYIISDYNHNNALINCFKLYGDLIALTFFTFKSYLKTATSSYPPTQPFPNNSCQPFELHEPLHVKFVICLVINANFEKKL